MAGGEEGEESRHLVAAPDEDEKLEILGNMAGGVAHSINNALQSILGYLQLAGMQIPSGSILAAYLEQIGCAADRLARLSWDMLAFSGRGKNRPEPLDISVLIAQFEPALAAMVAAPLRLRFMLADGLPVIEADPSQLRRAIEALVTNAVEAVGDAEGAITIRTGSGDSAFPKGMAFASGHQPQEGEVFLEVCDTGCGISPEITKRIFDPFFSTKLVGRGLGLAAVQGIVRGHGGTITVESTPGAGATFRILFPPLPLPAASRSPASPSGS